MLTLSSQQATNLLRYAREQLFVQFGLKPDNTLLPPTELDSLDFQKLNITLRIKGVLRASMSGRGATLTEAVSKAIHNCLNDKRFLGGPVVASELDKIHLELWVQVDKQPLDNTHLDEMKKNFDLGVHGIEIQKDNHYAYYKPSVAITSNTQRLERLLEKLCKKARLNPTDWQQDNVIIHKTHWLHYIEPIKGSKEATSLFRLRSRRETAINAETISQALYLTTRRLCASQRADGSYNYIYNAYKDTFDNEAFNMVRMAGCAYAVARASQCLQEIQPVAEASADKAIRYLLALSHPINTSNEGVFIADGTTRKRSQQGKLGTLALTLLALQFGPFTQRFADERKQLVNSILSLQNADGSFQCYIPSKADPIKGQNFFPGETLLALGHEFKHTQDQRLLDAAEKAFPYYQKYFQTDPSTAFAPWQIDAWRVFHEIQQARKNDQSTAYAEFLFAMVDWLLKYQYTADNSPSSDYLGGFRVGSLPSMSTTVYVEAIIRACHLAEQLGFEEKSNRYRDAARIGLAFSLKLQLTEEESFLFSQPELAIGGITHNLLTFQIRNDFDQHGMTAFIAALETPSVITHRDT